MERTPTKVRPYWQWDLLSLVLLEAQSSQQQNGEMILTSQKYCTSGDVCATTYQVLSKWE